MRAVLIGTWGHYVHLMQAAAKVPGFELVGVAPATSEDDPAAAIADLPFASDAGIFTKPAEMLRQTSPDVAIVSCRIDRIAPLAGQAAEAGCHLICEKPLAVDRSGLELLWDSVVTNGVQCYTMTPSRSHGLLQAAREAIASGRIGEVCLINARKSYKYGSRPEWFGIRDLYGGTIPWVGIHALDFIDALWPSIPVQVSAFHANLAHAERPDCEDAAVVILRLASGAMASISVDYFRPSSQGTHGDDWIRVVGDRGTVEVGMSRGVGELVTEGSDTVPLESVPERSYYQALLTSLEGVGKREPDEITRRGFCLTDLALRAREAADTRTMQLVPRGPWHGGKDGS